MDDYTGKKHSSSGDNTVLFPGNARRDEDDQPTGDELRVRKGKRTRRDRPVSAQSVQRRPKTHLAGEGMYAPTFIPRDNKEEEVPSDRDPKTTVYSPREKAEPKKKADNHSSKTQSGKTHGSVRTINHTDDRVSKRGGTTRYDSEDTEYKHSKTREKPRGETIDFPGNSSPKIGTSVIGTKKKEPEKKGKTESAGTRTRTAEKDRYKPTKKTDRANPKTTERRKAPVDITRQPRTHVISDYREDNETESGTPLKMTRPPRKSAPYKKPGSSANTKPVSTKPKEKAKAEPKNGSSPKKVKNPSPKKAPAGKKKKISPEEIRISHPKRNRPVGEAAMPDSSGRKKRRTVRKHGIAGFVSDVLNYELALPTVNGRSFGRVIVFLLAFVVILGCVSFGGVKLAETVCRVHSVKVTGNTAFDVEEIKRYSGIKNGASMYNINCSSVEKRIELSNPYIDAQVSRSWPGTIRIRVSDRTPAYAVDCGDNYLLIDADCVALEFVDKTSEKAQGLVSIKGIGTDNFKLAEKVGNNHADAHLADAVLVLSTQNKLSLGYSICEIDVLNINLISCMTDEGLQIILGTVDNLEDKLTRADGIIRELRQKGLSQSGILDMQEDGRYRKAENTARPFSTPSPTPESGDIVDN